MLDIIIAAVALAFGIIMTLLYKKKRKKIILVLAILGYWFCVTQLLNLVFGHEKHQLEVNIFPPNVDIGGFLVGESVILMWLLAAIILVLCLIFRIFVFPKFKDEPRGFQTLFEGAVEWLSGYTKSKSDVTTARLGGYMFAVGVIMIGCAVFEMFGVRAPTSDLFMAGSLAIVSFFLIQFHGIRKKGLLGRVKSFARPTPVVFPFEIIGMISTPVSLACRLFGNMLGGLIIMDLLYVALGNAASGIPAVLGLYFNVFHPLIQAYIFITLSLTFIKEAIEK